MLLPFPFLFFIIIIVLGRGTLWHLQKVPTMYQIFIFEFTPSWRSPLSSPPLNSFCFTCHPFSCLSRLSYNKVPRVTDLCLVIYCDLGQI
jgi:hypothetical protein